MTMALPDTIPLRREPEPAASTPMQELAWMGVFIVLLLLAFAVLRKYQAGGAARPGKPATGWLARCMGTLSKRQERGMKLISSARLTPQHSVHEVDWQGQRLLIGCAPQSIAVLAQAPVPPDGSGEAAVHNGQGTAP